MVHPSLRVKKLSLGKQFAICIDYPGRAFGWGFGVDEKIGHPAGLSREKGYGVAASMELTTGMNQRILQEQEMFARANTVNTGNNYYDGEPQQLRTPSRLPRVEDEDSFDRQLKKEFSYVNLLSKVDNKVNHNNLLFNKQNSSVIELGKVFRETSEMNSFEEIKQRFFFEDVVCSENGFILVCKRDCEAVKFCSAQKKHPKKCSIPLTSPQVKSKQISKNSGFSTFMVVYGDNSFGQLLVDFDDMVDRLLLVEIEVFEAPLKEIRAGDKHFIALTEEGRVFAWGDNSQGQCGVTSETLHPDSRFKNPNDTNNWNSRNPSNISREYIKQDDCNSSFPSSQLAEKDFLETPDQQIHNSDSQELSNPRSKKSRSRSEDLFIDPRKIYSEENNQVIQSLSEVTDLSIDKGSTIGSQMINSQKRAKHKPQMIIVKGNKEGVEIYNGKYKDVDNTLQKSKQDFESEYEINLIRPSNKTSASLEEQNLLQRLNLFLDDPDQSGPNSLDSVKKDVRQFKNYSKALQETLSRMLEEINRKRG